jgi:signal transduction histidine kinase
MSRLWRPGLRGRLVAVVVGATAVLLAALTVGFNVVLRSRLDHDANSLLRQTASAHLLTLSTVDGRLRVGEAPDAAAPDARVWVYALTRAIERSTGDTAVQRAADSLAGSHRRFLEVGASDARLYAVPVVKRGRGLGTLVAAVSLAPYERSARTALVASLVFALAVLAAVAVAARWAVSAALRPVARMTAEAAERSERDLDHRFALGEPHDELTRLAATFDRFLDRLAASLRREQRLTAEISHELRTPLAKIVAEAELALRRQRGTEEYHRALEAIRRSAGEMGRMLETLLSAARAEAGGGAGDAVEAARRAAAAYADAAGARGVEIEVEPAAGAVLAGAAPDVLERILAPLVDNGCRHARHRVGVSVGRRDGLVRVSVADDGPGLSVSAREHAFEPGYTEPGSNGAHGGAGLGLPLARRLARAVGGDVEVVTGGEGATFEVRLPAA